MEISIGNVKIKNPFFAAPLCAVSDLPYRLLVREHGCGLAWTEMTMARGLVEGNKKTVDYFRSCDADKPLVMQLGGGEPDIMGPAAEIAEQMGADFIDVNCGCPVPKMIKRDYGAGLLKNPPLIGQIVRDIRKRVRVPVMVKIRAGFTKTSANAAEVAKIAEDAGAHAITVHGRFRDEFFKGHSNWEIIGEVKKAVSIPVIGNGDIVSHEDAQRMMNETGCDAVMVGRGTFGRPWIFRDLVHQRHVPVTSQEWIDTVARHVSLMIDHYGERVAFLKLRSILCYYTKGLKNVREIRKKISKLESFEDYVPIRDELNELVSRCETVSV
ncbi:tRNA dihydrouridine synthase DusB [bacterium]|nr:tRNA dihydrouridine synthase DusB [bacterium]MCP5463227.1 tRNA dihydrouridine synthase DusB [bacterium]